jgi:hypothetical protein
MIYDLLIGDWGLGIGDWAQSPIPNPQSPIPILIYLCIFKKLKKFLIYFNIKEIIFNTLFLIYFINKL